MLLQAGDGVNGLMTYYHGGENGPVMFLGASIWDFRRTQCQALVDFVLGSMWGMAKNVVAGPPASGPARPPPAPPLRGRGPRRRTAGAGPGRPPCRHPPRPLSSCGT